MSRLSHVLVLGTILLVPVTSVYAQRGFRIIAPPAMAGRRAYVIVPAQPTIVVSPYGSYPISAYAAPEYIPAPVAVTEAPVANQNEAALANQIGLLSQQVQQLKRAQAQRPTAAPSASIGNTVVVFRDGHRMEIQNYVITKDTLWAFNENGSTRIAIDDLDLDATQKENHGGGLHFPRPVHPPQPHDASQKLAASLPQH